ncbi:MAG: S1C family serine protease [Defluviitaleaceae bacterium]|nr:S1C family serine protease [Defluviitaleaceae bacterium]MCL2836883.1 S1C family serine protease [Defluviitaleaceae bacterium]
MNPDDMYDETIPEEDDDKIIAGEEMACTGELAAKDDTFHASLERFIEAERFAGAALPPSKTYKTLGRSETYSLYLERKAERDEAASRQLDKFRRVSTLAIIIALIGGTALGFGFGAGSRIASHYWIPRMSSDAEELRQFTLNAGYLSADHPSAYSFADVNDMVSPAVVRISAIRITGSARFRSIASQSAGSGMIFHETANKYYIATNAHVIAGADQLAVSIENSPAIIAELVGMDEQTDLAVISVDKTDAFHAGVTSVTLVNFGDSDAFRVGDVVLAIGNSLGEGISSTNGIISARERIISIDGSQYTVMQTNAAINHGNSGGPLVTMTGEVIGMNTAKLKQTDRDEFVEGMGYSIPSNDMLPILEAIMRGENQTQPVTVRQNDRAVMGIRVRDTELAAGAVIWEVIPGGSAERAGLLAGDIILELNGAEITSGNNLVNALNAYRPGDTVILHILRETEGLDIGVTLISASELENLG